MTKTDVEKWDAIAVKNISGAVTSEVVTVRLDENGYWKDKNGNVYRSPLHFPKGVDIFLVRRLDV